MRELVETKPGIRIVKKKKQPAPNWSYLPPRTETKT